MQKENVSLSTLLYLFCQKNGRIYQQRESLKKQQLSTNSSLNVTSSHSSDNEMSEVILTDKQQMILDRKAASLEKANQQEAWRRIVIKVISWSEGLLPGGIIKDTDKLTYAEWDTYYTHTLKININTNREKLKKDLEDIKNKIESFNGFEK